MQATIGESLFMASSVSEAIAALAERGSEAAPLAGGTWVMRAPIRKEARRPFHVGLARIPELNGIDVGEREIRIGACVTHARLVDALADISECAGLCAAAEGAANPAVRQMATVGGNLCASDFPASDLAPALLSLDADVELARPGASERIPLARFLENRRSLEPGTLLTAVMVARRSAWTGHARLPLRKAGDYPVAIVSMAAIFRADDTVEDIRIAVGSVEQTARRWPQLERRLVGVTLDPELAHKFAAEESGAFIGRESVEAPAWYRVQVLPALVRRATRALLGAQ